MRHEWTEEHGWHAKVIEKYNQVFLNCHTICPVTEDELLNRKSRYTPTTKAEAETYEAELPLHGEDWQVDKNNVLLMAFVKGAATLPWSEERGKDLLEIPWKATSALATLYEPPMPKLDDQRHVDHLAEREKCSGQGWNHGIYHLGTRRQKGHQQQQPTLSKDTHLDIEKGAAVNLWYQHMPPYHQTLGLLHLALDRKEHEYNMQIVNHWKDTCFSAGIIRTERACFTYHPILLNARVAPHLDRFDSLSGIVAMTCDGSFTNGGNVVLPLFGRQYTLRPGDVMFLRASLIEHWISAYEGQRYSFVHAISENLNNLRDAFPAPLKDARQKRKVEDAADEDSGSVERTECPFCHKTFTNLKTHLSAWRKRIPKPRENGHDAKSVREWCDAQGWEPYYGNKSRAKKVRVAED